MRADVDGDDKISVDVENDSQVCFDFRGVNAAGIASRQLVDFMRTQPCIEWILFENREGFSRVLLLLADRFPKLRQNVRVAGEAVFH